MKNVKGKFHKSFTFKTNDPENPRIVLELAGAIRRSIVADREEVRLHGLLGEHNIEETVMIVSNKEEEPLKLTAEILRGSTQFDLDLREKEPGRLFELKIKNRLRKKGEYVGFVQLNTNYPEKPLIIISVSGKINTPLEIKPENLVFDSLTVVSDQEKIKKSKRWPYKRVEVFIDKRSNLKILNLEVENGLFQAEIKKTEQYGRFVENDIYEISVSPIQDKMKKGLNKDVLKLFTTFAGFEEVNIPLTALVSY